MPAKAAYLALEDDPSLELEFFIAEKLGMTLSRLRQEMTYSEFIHWTRYFARKAQRENLASKRQ